MTQPFPPEIQHRLEELSTLAGRANSKRTIELAESIAAEFEKVVGDPDAVHIRRLTAVKSDLKDHKDALETQQANVARLVAENDALKTRVAELTTDLDKALNDPKPAAEKDPAPAPKSSETAKKE